MHAGSGGIIAVAAGGSARQRRGARGDVIGSHKIGHEGPEGGGGKVVKVHGADLDPVLRPVHESIPWIRHRRHRDGCATSIGAVARCGSAVGGSGAGGDGEIRPSGNVDHQVIQQEPSGTPGLDVNRHQVEGRGGVEGEQAHRQRIRRRSEVFTRLAGCAHRWRVGRVRVGDQSDRRGVFNRRRLGGGEIEGQVGDLLAELDHQDPVVPTGIQIVPGKLRQGEHRAAGVLDGKPPGTHTEVSGNGPRGLIEGRVLARRERRGGGIKIKRRRRGDGRVAKPKTEERQERRGTPRDGQGIAKEVFHNDYFPVVG